jgi:phosphoribosylanthranilate isomerase
MRPKVKICCISSILEAKLAVLYGASALGLVGEMPSGPGIISDDLIKAIVPTVPPPIATFLLTSQTSAEGIVAHHQRVNTSVVQMVDALQSGTYQQIRLALSSVKLVQVIHVIDERTIDEALEAAANVDALLLDSGNPNLAIKELGGTGRVHNWELSRKIVEQSPVPIFLAGGLRPDNLRRAVDAVQPWGVDLCSGVRTNGRLDEIKLLAFFEEINKI